MAENRIMISEVYIKNFRSIRNATIKTAGFNILVGNNDVGKSNVLKALNLFFNNKTDYNTDFQFDSDFTILPKRSHERKEILIRLKFNIPPTFQKSGEYIWTRVWSQDSTSSETISNSFGELPDQRSRIPSALKRVQYRYVPAVKSAGYYKTLLGDMYRAVLGSQKNPLIESASAFSKQLKTYTKGLSREVLSRLSLSSELSIPNDLNDIFQALVFDTNDNDSDIHVPLTFRGDGIQARHIPIVLRYIAEEDQKSRGQGSMNVYTIWGFEEPENGLELLNTFRMADEFEEYSKDIQIFTTTHSPAFYQKKIKAGTQLFYISKKEGSANTIIETGKDASLIANNMGLMPLIAPYIAEKANELDQMKRELQNIRTEIEKKRERILIITEGSSDWKHIKTAYSVLRERKEYENIFEGLNIEFLEYEPKNSSFPKPLKLEMGCSALVSLCDSYAKLPQDNKIIFIADRDDASTLIKIGSNGSKPYKDWGNNVYSFALPIPSHRIATPLICIEHFYSDDEIKTEVLCSDGVSRRLYMGYEFDTYGRGLEIERLCTNRNLCGNNKIKIIDDAVLPSSAGLDNINYALPKMEFAAKVASGETPYNNFNFESFVPIFEIIQEINRISYVKTINDKDKPIELNDDELDLIDCCDLVKADIYLTETPDIAIKSEANSTEADIDSKEVAS